MGVETILAAVAGTAALTVTLIFLPVAIELAYPKDSGPRLISGCTKVTHIRLVTNIEEISQKEQKTGVQLFGLLEFLPSLEIDVI